MSRVEAADSARGRARRAPAPAGLPSPDCRRPPCQTLNRPACCLFAVCQVGARQVHGRRRARMVPAAACSLAACTHLRGCGSRGVRAPPHALLIPHRCNRPGVQGDDRQGRPAHGLSGGVPRQAGGASGRGRGTDQRRQAPPRTLPAQLSSARTSACSHAAPVRAAPLQPELQVAALELPDRPGAGRRVCRLAAP